MTIQQSALKWERTAGRQLYRFYFLRKMKPVYCLVLIPLFLISCSEPSTLVFDEDNAHFELDGEVIPDEKLQDSFLNLPDKTKVVMVYDGNRSDMGTLGQLKQSVEAGKPVYEAWASGRAPSPDEFTDPHHKRLAEFPHILKGLRSEEVENTETQNKSE